MSFNADITTESGIDIDIECQDNYRLDMVFTTNSSGMYLNVTVTTTEAVKLARLLLESVKETADFHGIEAGADAVESLRKTSEAANKVINEYLNIARHAADARMAMQRVVEEINARTK